MKFAAFASMILIGTLGFFSTLAGVMRTVNIGPSLGSSLMIIAGAGLVIGAFVIDRLRPRMNNPLETRVSLSQDREPD